MFRSLLPVGVVFASRCYSKAYSRRDNNNDPTNTFIENMFRAEKTTLFYQQLSDILGNQVSGLKPLNQSNFCHLLFRVGKMKRRHFIIDASVAKLIVQNLTMHKLNGIGLSRAMQLLIILASSSEEVRTMINKALIDKLTSCESLNSIDLSMCFYALHSTAVDDEVLLLMRLLAERVVKSSGQWNAQSLGNALYGLKKMSSGYQEIKYSLGTLALKISESEAVFDAQGIGNALYGLQGMSSDVQEVKDILKALVRKIAASDTVLGAQGIGNALYGLQSMSSDVQEVKDILKALTRKIIFSAEMLSSQHIGNALYGLQGMSSDVQEVKDMLKALASKIAASDTVLGAQGIGNSLYGLQGMSSDVQEVKGILSALTRKIASSDEMLSSQHIGNALYGLQGMSSDVQEVKDILKALASKIAASDAVLDAQGIGNALYGLQGMSSDVQAVKGILSVLTRKIALSDAVLSSQSICNALYGLQQMTAESEHVQTLLSTFASKIQKHSFEDLSIQQIGNAVYGLRNMDLTPEWCPVMITWLSKSEELLLADDASFSFISTLLQSFLLVSYDDQIPFLKSIVCFDLRGQLNEVTAKAWNAFNRAVLSLPPAGFQSGAEKKHVKNIISAVQRRQATSTFTTNIYLYGFEADLV